LKKKLEDMESELKNQKEKNSKDIQIQSKETNSLRKERDKLKKKNKELTEELGRLNQTISSLEHQILNQPPPQNNRGRAAVPRKNSQKQPNSQIQKPPEGYVAMNIYDKIDKMEESQKMQFGKSGDKLLANLVHFCMAKKIDIKQHLRKYDTSKNGRLNDEKFMNAIIELKTSFTENDIKELIKISKPKDGGDIIIDQFVDLLKSKDYNYKVKDDTIINSGNKQASTKYDLFENKPYNLDYP
jgi:Ca2+-binding EF-hand superfamily protein